jgi:hypothetical protein
MRWRELINFHFKMFMISGSNSDFQILHTVLYLLSGSLFQKYSGRSSINIFSWIDLLFVDGRASWIKLYWTPVVYASSSKLLPKLPFTR